MSSIIPYLTSFVAVVCYASLTVIAKKAQYSIPLFSFMTITLLIMAFFSLCTALIVEKGFKVLSLKSEDILYMALFGIINFVAFAAYMFSLSKIPVVHYQMIGTVMPVVAGILAFVVLKEPLLIRYVIGFLFVFMGIFITTGVYK